MTTRFEQLIEYVINDEQDKARELFHDIVVEKSRQIYEEMMDQEEMDEAKEEELDEDEEELDEAKEEDEEEDLDEAKEEDLDEAMVDMGNDMGSAEGAVGEGDAADQMMQDVEAEEAGMSEGEDEEATDDFADETGFDDFEGDEDKSEDLEDRVVDLEDKLDELMAEFESLMGDEGGDMGDEEMDVIDVDGEEDGMDNDMMEAVSLKAAPKPVTSEEGGINKKAVVAANSGAAGMEGKPVHTGGDGGGKHDSAAYSNSTKDLISDFQNKAGTSMKDQKSAPKPVTSQASGVNTKSPLKGR